MDYMDELDARRLLEQAAQHGDSDSIMAFRDKLDARHAVEQYNQGVRARANYRTKVGDPPEEEIPRP